MVVAGVGKRGGIWIDWKQLRMKEMEGKLREREVWLMRGVQGKQSPGSELGVDKRLSEMDGGQEGTGEEKEGAGKDEGNGGEIEREGSLVDEGSSGEAESSGSGLGGDERLSEVDGGQEGTEEEEAGKDEGNGGGELREREVW